MENPVDAQADLAGEVLESVGIDPDNNPYYIEEDEIKKHLSQSPKKIAEWLDTIEEGYL